MPVESLKIQSNLLLVDVSTWLKGSMRIKHISPKAGNVYAGFMYAFLNQTL